MPVPKNLRQSGRAPGGLARAVYAMSLACLLGGALAGCGPPAQDGGPAVPLGERIDGVATFYDGDGRGACSFDATADDFTAMNAVQWAGSGACGTCLEVAGPRGTIVARVVDLCPECPRGHLDLSRAAFTKIAEPREGRVSIRWQPVACPTSGNVRLKYKDGANAWWTAVQARNHRRPIVRFEVSLAGTWKALPRTSYNYFLEASGFGDRPATVRLTADDGSTLLATMPKVEPELEIDAGGQFR